MVRHFALTVVAVTACAFNSAGAGNDAGEDTRGDGDPSGSEGGPGGDSATSFVTSGASGDPSTSAATGTTGPDDTTGGPGPGSSGTSTGGSDATGSTGAGSTTTGTFDCTDVLYVAASTTIGAHDQPFYDVLDQLGANVTVVQDDLSVAADANGMCLVVVSASVTGSEVADKFRTVPVPVVTWEYAIYDDMDMTGDTLDTDFGPADPEEDITIVDAAHPLAAGLSGTLTVLAPAPGRMSWGVPAAAAEVVATLPSDQGRATLFAYAAGDAMVGLTAPAARVGFPCLTSDSNATINADGAALFEAAVTWAVQ